MYPTICMLMQIWIEVQIKNPKNVLLLKEITNLEGCAVMAYISNLFVFSAYF